MIVWSHIIIIIICVHYPSMTTRIYIPSHEMFHFYPRLLLLLLLPRDFINNNNNNWSTRADKTDSAHGFRTLFCLIILFKKKRKTKTSRNRFHKALFSRERSREGGREMRLNRIIQNRAIFFWWKMFLKKIKIKFKLNDNRASAHTHKERFDSNYCGRRGDELPYNHIYIHVNTQKIAQLINIETGV